MLARLSLAENCDCPRFCDGFPNKHVGATMLKFDRMHDRLLDGASQVKLVDVDPDDVLNRETCVNRQVKNAGEATGSRSANRGRPNRTSEKPPKQK